MLRNQAVRHQQACAASLRISKATVYKLCNTGRLGSVRVVNVIRVPVSALRRFVQQRKAP